MSEQEQGGAVQSASELASQVWILLESAYDAEADQLIRERDAAIRAQAIRECIEIAKHIRGARESGPNWAVHSMEKLLATDGAGETR